MEEWRSCHSYFKRESKKTFFSLNALTEILRNLHMYVYMLKMKCVVITITIELMRQIKRSWLFNLHKLKNGTKNWTLIKCLLSTQSHRRWILTVNDQIKTTNSSEHETKQQTKMSSPNRIVSETCSNYILYITCYILENKSCEMCESNTLRHSFLISDLFF